MVWDPQRLVILVLKSLFCMHKTTGEGCDPYSVDILVLNTLLNVLKTTDEVWDPYRLISLAQKSLFVAFACKTATLAPELQVSMGPRLRLLIYE